MLPDCTQIVDTNSAANLTYLGFGNVELRASSSAAPSNSVIQFGNNTPTTVSYRQIQNFYVNCNNDSIDGIDLDGLTYSAFDGITIANCKGTAPLRTVGTNTANWSNLYKGGTIYGTSSNTGGVLLGLAYPTSNGGWSFYGTHILGPNGNTGAGIDFEASSGSGVYGADIEGWGVGIGIADDLPPGGGTQFGGVTITGTYFEDDTTSIRVGYAGAVGSKVVGISVTGNYINCNNVSNTNGVLLMQVSGFTVTGNRFYQCQTQAVSGYSDGTNQGADNGFVGANFIDGGQGVLLQGSNNTVTNSIATKSSNYTLSGADSWINVTGNTAITVPHAMTGQQWNVFNSGTGNVSLACDSGTINGQTTISITSSTGKTVTTDGINCFAH